MRETPSGRHVMTVLHSARLGPPPLFFLGPAGSSSSLSLWIFHLHGCLAAVPEVPNLKYELQGILTLYLGIYMHLLAPQAVEHTATFSVSLTWVHHHTHHPSSIVHRPSSPIPSPHHHHLPSLSSSSSSSSILPFPSSHSCVRVCV